MTPAVVSFVLFAAPQLSYSNGEFTITDGDQRTTVPLSAARPPEPYRADKLNMRIGDTLITFDERGLGIQYRSRGGFTNLPYVATSPLLFNSEEINRINSLIALNTRTADVTALSGFELVGDKLHLLMRWEENNGTPWLEALLDVDTSGLTPKVNILGRFSGISFAKGAVSDELYARGTLLYTPIKTTNGLGLGLFETTNGGKRNVELGPPVDSCAPLGGNFVTQTKTSHDMTSIGYLDTKTERWRAVFESRGQLVASSPTKVIRIREQATDVVYSPKSGARLDVQRDTAIADAPHGVLVWSPADKPTTATLRDTDSLSVLAQWKR